MLTAELDYHLPPELIAQAPVQPRDHSRLMRLRRDDGSLAHHRFHELAALLRPDDLLVFNDTRVLHARLRGRRTTGGQVEALLLREVATNVWEALLKPSARLKVGGAVVFHAAAGDLAVTAELVERTAAGWLVRFVAEPGADLQLRRLLPRLGEVPLPPYIKRALQAESQYQTVYARPVAAAGAGMALDSAAAPTAGLHFTAAVLGALAARGIKTAHITLGVGVGTFRPVQVETLEAHMMHEEEFEVPASTADAIAAQRQRGGRVVAVGTTTTRVLESVTTKSGTVQAGYGSTHIFIRPGHRFDCVDALLTNFHLPRSTLLAMVAAFAESRPASSPAAPRGTTGLDMIRSAYKQAIAEGYRFFSFGDAMLIE